jgi:hypothetical protein
LGRRHPWAIGCGGLDRCRCQPSCLARLNVKAILRARSPICLSPISLSGRRNRNSLLRKCIFC